MTQTDDFYVGQRVQLTEAAFERGIHLRLLRPVLGTVRGFGRSPNRVRVLRDGVKTVHSYHSDFWRAADAGDERIGTLDDDMWREVARDGHGFVRTQEEWDTLATACRELIAAAKPIVDEHGYGAKSDRPDYVAFVSCDKIEALKVAFLAAGGPAPQESGQ